MQVICYSFLIKLFEQTPNILMLITCLLFVMVKWIFNKLNLLLIITGVFMLYVTVTGPSYDKWSLLVNNEVWLVFDCRCWCWWAGGYDAATNHSNVGQLQGVSVWSRQHDGVAHKVCDSQGWRWMVQEVYRCTRFCLFSVSLLAVSVYL